MLEGSSRYRIVVLDKEKYTFAFFVFFFNITFFIHRIIYL